MVLAAKGRIAEVGGAFVAIVAFVAVLASRARGSDTLAVVADLAWGTVIVVEAAEGLAWAAHVSMSQVGPYGLNANADGVCISGITRWNVAQCHFAVGAGLAQIRCVGGLDYE